MSIAETEVIEQRAIVNSYIVDTNEAFQRLEDSTHIDVFDTVDTYRNYRDFKRVLDIINGQLREAAQQFSAYLQATEPTDLHDTDPHIQHIIQYRLHDEMGNLDSLMKRRFESR